VATHRFTATQNITFWGRPAPACNLSVNRSSQKQNFTTTPQTPIPENVQASIATDRVAGRVWLSKCDLPIPFIPRAAVLARPPQQPQVPSLRGIYTCLVIPWATVLPSPSERLQVSEHREARTYLITPRAAVCLGPSQPLYGVCIVSEFELQLTLAQHARKTGCRHRRSERSARLREHGAGPGVQPSQHLVCEHVGKLLGKLGKCRLRAVGGGRQSRSERSARFREHGTIRVVDPWQHLAHEYVEKLLGEPAEHRRRVVVTVVLSCGSDSFFFAHFSAQLRCSPASVVSASQGRRSP